MLTENFKFSCSLSSSVPADSLSQLSLQVLFYLRCWVDELGRCSASTSKEASALSWGLVLGSTAGAVVDGA